MSLSYYSILSSGMRFKAVTKYIQNRYIFYSFPCRHRMKLGTKLAFWLLGENFLYGHGVGWAQYLLSGCWGKISFMTTAWAGRKTCFLAGGGKFPFWPRRGLGAKLAFWLLGENFLYGHGVGWALNWLSGCWWKMSFMDTAWAGH